MDRSKLILEAITASGTNGITVAELIKSTGASQAQVWNSISKNGKMWGVAKDPNWKPGQPARYKLAAASESEPKPLRSGPAAIFEAPRQRAHWKTQKTKDYEAELPAIFGLMAEISIFGDRNMSLRECFLEAEEKWFVKIGKVDMIRRPATMTMLEGWEAQFNAARQSLLDEIMKKPDPVIEQSIVKAPLSEYGHEELFAEVGRRLGSILTTPATPQPAPIAPPAAQEPPTQVATTKTPTRIVVVGLLDRQHSAISDYPPIQTRIKSGTLELTFCSKDKARLNLRAGAHAAVILSKLSSHSDWGQVTSQFDRDCIATANGISGVRSAVIDFAFKRE